MLPLAWSHAGQIPAMRASASSSLHLTLAESYWSIVKCPDAGGGSRSSCLLRFLFHHCGWRTSNPAALWQPILSCCRASRRRVIAANDEFLRAPRWARLLYKPPAVENVAPHATSRRRKVHGLHSARVGGFGVPAECLASFSHCALA